MFLLRTPKHAKRSKVKPVLVAGGLTASLAVADVSLLSASASAASASDFAKLRQCESGGNYRINTGNGYYGAYQFDRSTWRGLGYSGLPHQASPGTQDAAARKLQAQRGWQPWPACSRKLGLRSGRGSAEPARTARVAPRASRGTRLPRPVSVRVRTVVRPGTAPHFNGRNLTIADRQTYRVGARTWQARMAARGWNIAADGYFGPQSARVAAQFAREKGLRAAPGVVNRAVWRGAWTLRVG